MDSEKVTKTVTDDEEMNRRFEFESMAMHYQAINQRLVWAIVIISAFMCITVVSGLIFFNHFVNSFDIETESITLDTEDGGNNNYIGANANGAITNGETDSNKDDSVK